MPVATPVKPQAAARKTAARPATLGPNALVPAATLTISSKNY